MDTDALLLGFIQGLTEFLPVSSSAHLALAQMALGWSEPPLAFDLVLHGATMAATLLFFRKDVLRFLIEWTAGLTRKGCRDTLGWRYGWAVLLGTVATVAVGLPLKGYVEAWMLSPLAVGLALCVTASLLWGASLLPVGERPLKPGTGLLVGFVQGIAAIPGISRSGSTIVTGLALRLPREEAFRLSFLLSIPAILGAMLLEFLDLGKEPSFLPPLWWLGALVAFATGWFALLLLRQVVTLGRWRLFSVYCACLGLVAITTSFFR